MTILEEKKALRKKIRAIIQSRVQSDSCGLSKKSAEVCEKIAESSEFLSADCVFCYIPLKTEVCCISIAEIALRLNKKVCVPRVGENFSMDFFLLEKDAGIFEQLEKGAFGILEPKRNLSRVDLDDSSLRGKKILMIVPGLAFSKSGARLGRGKGFYDRYIARLLKTECVLTTAGLCFDFQIQESIPTEKTDIPVDFVVFA